MMPSTAITRYELSAPFSEFELMVNRQGFIGPQVFRVRPVGLQAADVGKLPLEEILQQRKTKRAPGAGYRRGDFEFDKYSYATDEHGWEEPMDDRTIRIYSDMIDAEEVHSQRAMNFVLEGFERDAATALYDTAVWTGASLATALSNEWDDYANATPIEDIIGAREKVISGSGLDPNALVCNSLQYFHLCNTDQIVDRVKYTAMANQEQMRRAVAEVLGLERIIVAGGLTNTANPRQTGAIGRIWNPEYASLARVATSDDPREPCVGRTFIWTGDGPGSVGSAEELALIVEEYREESVRGGVIRARNDRDIVVMYKEAAHLLSNVLTL